MRIRPVYLSDGNKIGSLSARYSVDPQLLFPGQYVFEFSGEVVDQLPDLDRLTEGGLRVYRSKSNNGTLLVQARGRSITGAFSDNGAASGTIRKFIEDYNRFFSQNVKPVWQIRNRVLDFNRGPLITGILNVTPDSFSDGGSFFERGKAVDQAMAMIEAGAQIIDVGGESTRPGADPVSIEDELERVVPVIRKIRESSDALISIDTYKSSVAEQALAAGADLINDISGCGFDAKMKEVAARYDCPVVIMHILGTPKNMQQNPEYENVCAEIFDYFEDRINELEKSGVNKIILDPGIGFGKQLDHNLKILNNLREFTWLRQPLMVGVSRKSFIGAALGKDVGDRLSGSLAAGLIGVQNGADILRVHDVAETRDVVNMFRTIESSGHSDIRQ